MGRISVPRPPRHHEAMAAREVLVASAPWVVPEGGGLVMSGSDSSLALTGARGHGRPVTASSQVATANESRQKKPTNGVLCSSPARRQGRSYQRAGWSRRRRGGAYRERRANERARHISARDGAIALPACKTASILKLIPNGKGRKSRTWVFITASAWEVRAGSRSHGLASSFIHPITRTSPLLPFLRAPLPLPSSLPSPRFLPSLSSPRRLLPASSEPHSPARSHDRTFGQTF